MSRTTIIIAVVILIVFGGLGVFILMNNSKTQTAGTQNDTTQLTPLASDTQSTPTTSTNPANQAQTTEVSYTDSGFSPQDITIKSGDIIKWTNNSSKPMWVASNPHPVHTDYPGFDELQAVGKGESYSFTFTVVGVHKYHNHLSPRDGGSVTVQ